MLNSGEYFVTKLLVKGDVEENKDFIFKVTVEDLPPEILSRKPPVIYKTRASKLIPGMVFMIVVLIFLIAARLLIKPSPFSDMGSTILIVMYVIGTGFTIFTWFYFRLGSKNKYSEILKKFSI